MPPLPLQRERERAREQSDPTSVLGERKRESDPIQLQRVILGLVVVCFSAWPVGRFSLGHFPSVFSFLLLFLQTKAALFVCPLQCSDRDLLRQWRGLEDGQSPFMAWWRRRKAILHTRPDQSGGGGKPSSPESSFSLFHPTSWLRNQPCSPWQPALLRSPPPPPPCFI